MSSRALTIEDRVARMERFLRYVYGTVDVERFKKIDAAMKEIMTGAQKNPRFKESARYAELVEEIEQLRSQG